MANIRYSPNSGNPAGEISTKNNLILDPSELLRQIQALEDQYNTITGTENPGLKLTEEQLNALNGPKRVKRYLSEIWPAIYNHISEHRKTAINAPTGSGKTYIVRELIEAVKAGKFEGVRTVVYVAPLQVIAVQQGNELPGNLPVIMQGSRPEEIREAFHAPAVICTTDSLRKIWPILERAYLVPDEIHDLPGAFNYRDKAIKDLWQAQNIAPRVLALSANVPAGLENFGYKILNIEREENQEYPTTLNIYHEGSEAGIIRDHMRRKVPGKCLVMLNDVKTLESYAHDIKAAGKSCTIFSSKARKYKEENPEYQQFINTGKLPEGIDYFLCTSVLEMGASITDEITEILIINERDHVKASQFIARARANNDINKIIPLTIYQSAKNVETATKWKELTLKRWRPKDRKTEAQELEISEILSVDLCTRLNQNQIQSEEEAKEILHRYGEDPLHKTAQIDENTGHWLPFAPAVMWYAHQRYIERTFPLFIADLREIIPGLKIQAVNVCRLDADGIAEPVKQLNNKRKENAFALFAENPQQYAEAIAATTRDRNLIKDINWTYGAPSKPTEETKEYILNHVQTINAPGAELPLRRSIKLKAAAARIARLQRSMTLAKLAGIVATYQGRGEFAELYNRVLMIAAATNPAGSYDRLRHEQGNRIKKKIRKAGIMGEAVSIQQLTDIARKITGDKDANRNATRVKELFTYEREGRKIRLTGYVELSDIFNYMGSQRCHRSDPEKLTQSAQIQQVTKVLSCTRNTIINSHTTSTPEGDPDAVPF